MAYIEGNHEERYPTYEDVPMEAPEPPSEYDDLRDSEEAPSDYYDAAQQGYAMESAAVAKSYVDDNTIKVSNGGTTINLPQIATGGTYTVSGSGFGQDREPDSETPYEVLEDHKQYLEGRKKRLEEELEAMDKVYAATEERLTTVADNIKATSEAMKPLDKPE